MKYRIFIRSLLFLMLTVFFVGIIPASDSPTLLSEEEKLWVQNHGPIRVSNEMSWAPFNFNERGVPSGYSIDVMNLAAETLNIDIEFETGPSWNEFLEMLDRNEIDAILNMAKTPQRAGRMLFTKPYARFSLALFTRIGTNKIKDFQNLSGMTFAVPDGFWLEEILAEYPDINVLTVADTEEAILAVSYGQADALYDVMPVVQYLSKRLFITNLQIGGVLNIGDREQIDLHIAVRKDQEILQGILDKGISAISPADFLDLRTKWLSSEEIASVESLDRNIKLYYLIMIIIIGIAIMVGLLFFLRRIIMKVKVLKFRSIWGISIIGMSIVLVLVVSLGWLTINRVNQKLKGDLADSMNVVLDATEKSLFIWIENNLQMVKRDAGNPNIESLTENLLEVNTDSVEQRAAFRSYISGSLGWLNEEMYQLIGTDSRILVSNDPRLEGTVSAISIRAAEELHHAFDGETLLIPTFDTSVNGEAINPRMFFISPVRDQKGNILAVLARSEDSSRDFSRLVTLGYMGRTGETYAFVSTGQMISKSRFETQLAQIGLLGRRQSSVLNIVIQDPGVNLMKKDLPFLNIQDLELTYMASKAVKGINSQSMSEYRDYRGVPVFGVWHWDSRYNFGIATEVDIKEGLDSFYIIRNSIIFTLAVTILLAVLVTLVSLIFGEKSNQSLSESRANLEERVNDRTRELSQSNKTLNNTIEALTHPFYVIEVKTHKILLANQAAILQGKQGASTCYSLTHNRDVPCDGEEHRCPMVEVVKTKQPAQVEHIHTNSDGNTIHAEVHGYPILDEKNEVVQMIEYSLDITDRKNAEQNTKRHLEELQRFNTLTIGREEKMIELKIEINELHRQLNLPEKYVIVTGEEELITALNREVINEQQS